MTRWKASASHLCLSVLVIGGIALAVFLLWYPYALYKVAGLDRILLVMLGIDLTAGPLLTLILFRPGKRGLKFDLMSVAVAQIAFLSYGLHTLWAGRPVFLVGTAETFTLVFANEIDAKDLPSAKASAWRKLSCTGPVLVGARMPADPAGRAAVMREFMDGGAGIERTPRHYVSFDLVAPDILATANTSNRTPASASRPATDRKDTSRSLEMPVLSRHGEGRLLIDASSAMPEHTVGVAGE